MKKNTRFILYGLMVIAAMSLAACGAALPAGVEAKLSADGQSAKVEFTGVVDSIASDQWVISGQTLLITSQTSIDDSILVGNTVKVEATVTADGKVTANKIELPRVDSSDPKQKSTPTGFNDKRDEFIGVVEAITADSWKVGGQTFGVTAQTEFKGNILLGDNVKVHYVLNSDGTMTATEIELAADMPLDPALTAFPNLEITGKLEAITPEAWTVKGQVFQITPQTEIKDEIFLGDVVKIHYLKNSDGTFTATEIELAGDNQAHNSEKKLTGILEELSSTQATISGIVVLITPETMLDSDLAIGQKVKAEVVTGSDGNMTALKIESFNNSSGKDDKNGLDNSGKGNNKSDPGGGDDGRKKTEPGDDHGGDD